MFKEDASLKWKKIVEDDEWNLFLHFQISVPSIINFRYPYFVIKMATIGEGLLSIIWKCLPQIKSIAKKYKIPCSAVHVHVTLRFVNFISCQTYG